MSSFQNDNAELPNDDEDALNLRRLEMLRSVRTKIRRFI